MAKTNINWTLRARLDHYSMPEPNSGCWLWLGSLCTSGYGLLGIGNRKIAAAHRLSWEAARGQIKDGMQVLHKCDVRACINPGHLFLGTHLDNMRDRDAKGRREPRKAKGTKHGMSKLTAEQVIAIRADTRSHRDIAADYGVAKSNVQAIRAGLTWAHLQNTTRAERCGGP